MNALNVATPFIATTEFPESVTDGEEESVMVSVDPVPDVITAPAEVSTETVNVVQAEPAVAVDGGSTVKTTLLGVLEALVVKLVTLL